jgi:hypothetical protein
MKDWKSALRDDPTEWLLEESDPSVRYFTFRWLFDKPQEDIEVIAASDAIARSVPVQKILKRQRPGGYWGSNPHPHYGSRGHLMLLTWLGYRGDEAVRQSMQEYINKCVSEDGAYGVTLKGRTICLPCHGAGLLRMMLWFGLEDDPRGRQIIDWLIRIQQPEGVWPCVSKLKYSPCLWATADVMRVMQELPASWFTPQVEEARKNAVEIFLNSGLTRYEKEKVSPLWFKFGFPLQWDTDILEVLELVAPYVAFDEPRIQDQLSFILDKQDASGRWPRDKYPKGGTWMQQYIEFERIGQPSKWVTLHALKMLKMLFRD